MTKDDRQHHVEVNDGDRTIAAAEVTTSVEPGGTARVSLHAEPGHLAPGSGASLVDAVLDLPEMQDSARLKAAIPLGDSESLDRIRERCQDVSTHPGPSKCARGSKPFGRRWHGELASAPGASSVIPATERRQLRYPAQGRAPD